MLLISKTARPYIFHVMLFVHTKKGLVAWSFLSDLQNKKQETRRLACILALVALSSHSMCSQALLCNQFYLLAKFTVTSDKLGCM